MISWRSGKAGFVGGAKRAIKGFFSFQYTVTTESEETESLSFGVPAIIDSNGQGINSLIDSNGIGVESEMTESFGVSSIIGSNGSGVGGGM